jgi:hypothetical protein
MTANKHIDEVLTLVASISKLCTEVKIIDKTIFITLFIFKLLSKGEPSLWRTVSFFISYLKKLASPINFKRISKRYLILFNHY